MRQPVPFGKYLLLDRISVGGMAEVFKAKSYGVEGFEKVIAIKRILPSMGEDADFIKMFIDEAKIAGQLSHANICQIFELGKITGAHFIAMEYIWGKDLLQIQNRAKRRKVRLPVLMTCYIIAKACEGLHYAHKKRDPMGAPMEIVHRDCSPQNILVSYEGEVKIIDFGIARAASRSSRTQAGVLKGKFGYMSPEQVRGLPLDRRSDIFSLGTVLYETLTGERLFVGESDFSTLERVRNADVARPSQLNPNVPPEVERIVMKALARDRDERYQWCAEMQADLQAYLTQQEEVVSNKGLGEAVRSLFLTELQREKEQMERYKKVGRDGLITGVPQAEAVLEVDAELGEAGPVDGDPTVLGGPDFEAMFPSSPAIAETQLATVDDARPVGSGGANHVEIDRSAYSSDFDESPTAIFDEEDERVGASVSGLGASKPSPIAARLAAGNSSGGPGPSGPTMLGPGAASALSPRAMRSSAPPQGAQSSPSHPGMPPRAYGTGNDNPANPSGVNNANANANANNNNNTNNNSSGNNANNNGSHAGNVSRHGVQGPPSSHGYQPVVAYPSQSYPSQSFQRPAQVVAFQSRGRDRSYAVRDIAIGVGIAAIVLTAFAVGRFLLSGDDDGDKEESAKTVGASGSIEVAIVSEVGSKAGEVLIDDKVVGQVTSDAPLVFMASEGSHRIIVRGDGVKPCEKQVAVSTGEKAQISCEMKAAASPEVSSDAGVGAVAGDGGAVGVAAGSEQDTDGDDLVVDSDAAMKAEKARRDKERAEREKRDSDNNSDNNKDSDRDSDKDKDKDKDRDSDKDKDKDKDRDSAKDKDRDSARDKDKDVDGGKGYLVANSSPFARVIVDGRNTGKMTPMGTGEKIALSPGRHSVTFVVGSKKYKYGVTIKAGEIKRFYRQLPVKKKPAKADDEEPDDEED